MELFNSDFHFSKNLMIITLGKTNQFIRKGKKSLTMAPAQAWI